MGQPGSTGHESEIHSSSHWDPHHWDLDHWNPHYSDHLKIRTYDHVLAWIFILGTVAGVLGNSCAVCFFWPRRKKTIHDMLYLTITAVDLITVSSSFPLIASLLNDRHPLLFENQFFCGVWTSLVILTTEMSIFLAMVICVTRTMIMKYPKRPINRSLVIGAIIAYFTVSVVLDVLYIGQRWILPSFKPIISACWVIPIDKLSIPFYLGNFLQVCKFFVPSLLTLICFVVGIRILMQKPVLGRKNGEGFRRVSVTISIFTGVFLFFNIPNFLFVVWGALRIFGLRSELELFDVDDKRMYFIHLMLQILPMFLNAVVNPLLYALRMKEYHDWNQDSFKSLARRFSSRKVGDNNYKERSDDAE